jgi:hypothetical protein
MADRRARLGRATASGSESLCLAEPCRTGCGNSKKSGLGLEGQIIVAESEEQLISTARDAVSQCNWVVGECASKWTQRYARNRTDGDFGQMVGLSGDQIFQRRRVWEAFGTLTRTSTA